MKKLGIGIGVVIVLIVGVVVVFLMNINSVVKEGIEAAGPEILGVPVSVDAVNISFMNGSGSIKGLAVMNPAGYSDGEALRVSEMSIKLDAGSVTSDKIRIYEILINEPSINYEGNLKDSNLQTLQRAAAGDQTDTTEDSETTASAPNLMIDKLTVNNAQMNVQLSFLEEPLSMVLPELAMEDIGKDGDMTAGEVVKEVLSALNKSLGPLIKENAGGVTDRLKEEVGKKLEDGVNKLKGLFKRD